MNIRIVRAFCLVIFSGLISFLSACSTGYNSSNSNARALPKIPEIRGAQKKRTVQRPRQQQRHTKPQVKRYPKKAPAKPYVAKVKKYSITSTSSTVITQREVAAVQKEITNQDAIRKAAKNRATVDIDPYSTIPENSSTNNSALLPPAPPSGSSNSSAVKSLMNRARADLAIGNTQSAVSKLERGLRIESQNANIWNLLAKAHYDQNDYQQAITMAKKSIRYASEDDLVSQNWALIQKASKKSDDTIALKEALDYFKVNP